MAEHFNNLTPEQQESLVLLAEEAGEVVQRVTKILRFGLRKNPYTQEENSHALSRELGDLLAAVEVLYQQGIIDENDVMGCQLDKLTAFRKAEDGRLCHLKVR